VSQWFNDLIGTVAREETVDFTVTSALSVGGVLPNLRPLVPAENYISIKVKSLRLPYVRKGVTKFHGVVHTFANLAGAGQAATEFASATTPTALSGLDPRNLSNVITIDRDVVGPTPWNGGDLRLQVGLFSVVEQELAGPFLATMTALSDKVGVAFVTSAKPFLDVISAGIGALTRQVGSVRLEIGMDRTFSPPKPGHYAVIAAPVGELAGAEFDLDPNDGKLKLNGKHYEARPYLVFTIEAVEQQARWGEITELQTAYRLVTDAARANDQSKARAAMASFRLIALTSTDLTMSDAARLVQKVDERLKIVFAEPTVNLESTAAGLPEFDRLDLYG
jgi:hypothetical protein